jgi:hypothetical protein
MTGLRQRTAALGLSEELLAPLGLAGGKPVVPLAIRDADSIVVLDEGRVAETGAHDELLRAGGIYAQLFTMQTEGYQRDNDVTWAFPGAVRARQ